MKLSEIFNTRPNYQIYMLCLAIGIMYDKIIDRDDQEGDEQKSVPRNVITNNDNGKLDFFFQAAILSTSLVDFNEEKRLELAFGESTDFNKVAFLTRYANFGVTKLVELIGDTPIESMNNIKNFLISSVEGSNIDLEGISDDILLEE